VDDSQTILADIDEQGSIPDLSYWLSYRKGLTDRFMPEPKWLPKLYHLPPYWYDFSFVLQAQQTLKLRQSAKYDGWLLSIAGFSNQSAGFQVRMLDMKRNRFWSKIFIQEPNFAGTASQRYHLRVPQRFRRGDPFQLEMMNLSTSALKGSVTLEACHDGTPPK
jgi:hypothetical protein